MIIAVSRLCTTSANAFSSLIMSTTAPEIRIHRYIPVNAAFVADRE